MKKWIISVFTLIFIAGFPIYNSGAGPLDWFRGSPSPQPMPSITDISSPQRSAGEDVIIVGSNFGTSSGNVIFKKGGSESGAGSIERWGQNRIVVTIPDLDPGTYDIIVRSTGGLESNQKPIDIVGAPTVVAGVATDGPECQALRLNVRNHLTYEGKIKSYKMEGGWAFFTGATCRFEFEKCQIQGEISSALTDEDTSVTGYNDPEYNTIKHLYMMNYCQIVRDAYLSGKSIKVRANTISTEGDPSRFIMKQPASIEIISGP